jgi:hypothetical protein
VKRRSLGKSVQEQADVPSSHYGLVSASHVDCLDLAADKERDDPAEVTHAMASVVSVFKIEAG